ncbi:HU family DNA-binding protein [Dysgonomonas sp. Marseille-P4677]|uniref:HU family DNA-binding protein n=1 Tax=Dysgonomonas sp. Marseille-P4677 TaxID=2364790 RepID=UPI001914CBAC|nr:HU family DNA-binding protein [Dysgonomonas sp. Marseille-P4677]MBK5721812.1 HU family DNA-binding protein [Dysgonomonas sp. Marseille-P4677]
MNKKEVITRVSQLSGIEYTSCDKVIEALEQVLSEELESSNGIRNAFGKVYKLIGFHKK